jgi:hypothetical protein
MRNRDIAMIAVLISLSGATGYLARRHSERDVASPAIGTTSAAKNWTSSAATKESSTMHHLRSTNFSSTNAHKPLPTADAPLAQTFDALKARADAGDTDAASRLFHDVNRCFASRNIEHIIALVAPIELGTDLEKADSEQFKAHEEMLKSMQSELDMVKRTRPFCSDVGDEKLDQFFPIMLQAAQGGDARAISCYLGTELMNMPGLLHHPEWLEQFKQNALTLAETGVAQGDWATVGLLAYSYGGAFRYSPLNQVTGVDPALAYRYFKLELLGSSDKFTTKANSQLAVAAQRLTAAQIAAGDAWAQDTFSRNFANTSSNGLSNGVNTCQGLDD